MTLQNCTRCGKVYQGTRQAVCPDCLDAEREEFESVRSFIKDNPKVSVEVVVEATGVDEDRIRDFLRQGRLDQADLSGPILECQRCGKPIYRGEYCVLCQVEMRRTFKSSDSRQDRKGKPKKSAAFARRYRDGK